MSTLLLILRTELVLFLRGRGVWLAGLFTVLFGIWGASTIRDSPLGAWATLGAAALLLSLLLSFISGDQISRDREYHIDGVLLSTPITTTAYVWGKFLAAVSALVGLSGIYLVAQLAMDQFDSWRDPPFLLGHSYYPPFGPWPYVVVWGMAIVVPLIFGTALTLTGITLLRGQRILAYAPLLLLWLGPPALRHWPTWLDLTEANLSRILPLKGSMAAVHLVVRWKTSIPPDSRSAHQVVHLAQSDFFQIFPDFFLGSRVIYLGIALLLIVATTCVVHHQRRNA